MAIGSFHISQLNTTIIETAIAVNCSKREKMSVGVVLVMAVVHSVECSSVYR
jgi:hypothetical protein